MTLGPSKTRRSWKLLVEGFATLRWRLELDEREQQLDGSDGTLPAHIGESQCYMRLELMRFEAGHSTRAVQE